MRKRKFFDHRYCRERRKANILASILLWSVLSYWLISRFVVGGTEVVGRSMWPTMEDGERLIIDRFSYHFHRPVRGDIIALSLPGEKSLSVKRVIAGPGEQVQIKNGCVWLNGQVLPEPYLPATMQTASDDLSSRIYTVGPSRYFVLGDNRRISYDSRFFGAIRREAIAGRIILR